MKGSQPRKNGRRLRLQTGLGIVAFGLLIFILGVDPGLFGVDRSPVIGFVQIAVFLVGLAIICFGGYITLNMLWNGGEKSIAADIGYRLVSTGFVISVAAGLADIFGFGTHPYPNVPHFGPLQALGVLIGEGIIALGFILFIPWRRRNI